MKSPIADSLLVCDEIIDTPDTEPIDSHKKKAKHEKYYHIFQTTFFLTLLLLINVTTCHYCIKY